MFHVVPLPIEDGDTSAIKMTISFAGRLKGGFYFAPIFDLVLAHNLIT